MPARLIIAYLLMALLIGGVAGAIWWGIHNSRHQRLKRYYREKRDRTGL
jgi:hypothetical protein